MIHRRVLDRYPVTVTYAAIVTAAAIVAAIIQGIHR